MVALGPRRSVLFGRIVNGGIEGTARIFSQIFQSRNGISKSHQSLSTRGGGKMRAYGRNF
jgi:hypothetical protein